mmetsp:Transcript_89282/g.139756  ORF Transcript_89282/g.139756 Transcript_89282/m.139756 type:complete len:214 (-) Transcript_89282:155-796(-)
MSNRGRQNVASFLIFDLGVDWRRGADWFESCLIDYDVTANWCNWVFAAGLTGGRINRFNILRQAKNYDPDGAYVRHWVSELRDVPNSFIHEPWLMSEKQRIDSHALQYPSPCIEPSVFPSGVGPVPVQLQGLKGRGKSMSHDQDGQTSSRHRRRGKGGGIDSPLEALQVSPDNVQPVLDETRSSTTRRWKSKQSKPSERDESNDFLGPDWLRQ